MEDKNRGDRPSPGENDFSPDEVARRAYALYEARGGEPGHELEDWLQAEGELNQQEQDRVLQSGA